ncbi:MAG TPA: hypothetical protein VD993_13195 [Chitinophagaceae bacterium]|nr:hypothetical protein [Chitinophagaceae bacterium]
MLRKSPLSLLLAGAAAFAAYKYTRMSPQQRKDLVGNLKERGRKIFGQFMPGNKTSQAGATANGQHFGEGSQYQS